MKHYMVFNTDKEDDKFELESAIKGKYYYFTLLHLDTFLRNKIKYGDLPEKEEKCFQEVRDELNQLLQDEGVFL